MDFDSTLGMLARHRVVAVVGVLLALVAGVVVGVKTDARYTTQGTVLLVPPALTPEQAKQTGRFGDQNPLLGFDNALVINSRLAVQALSDPDVEKRLRDSGATASYTLQNSVDQVTPLVIVKSSGTDRDEVARTADVVMDEVSTYLSDVQTAVGAPPGTLITTRTLTSPAEPTKSWSKSITRGVIAAVVVLLLTGLLIFVLDRRHRSERLAQEDVRYDPAGPDGSDDVLSGVPRYDDPATVAWRDTGARVGGRVTRRSDAPDPVQSPRS
jgi:hypothetical protein